MPDTGIWFPSELAIRVMPCLDIVGNWLVTYLDGFTPYENSLYICSTMPTFLIASAFPFSYTHF